MKLWHGWAIVLNSVIPARICNHTHYKVWKEITFPFPNFNGAAVYVWVISSHIYLARDYLSVPMLKLIRVSKMGLWQFDLPSDAQAYLSLYCCDQTCSSGLWCWKYARALLPSDRIDCLTARYRNAAWGWNVMKPFPAPLCGNDLKIHAMTIAWH